MKEKILALLGEKGEIPPLPDILTRLSIKINSPECDLSEIAALIKTEPVLAGKLTKLANSVFYGGGLDKAEDISTAIMRLGLKIVMDLAYALKIPKLFAKSQGLDQRQFWRHSLAVAIFAKILGRKLLNGRAEQETAYLAGLMHDVGILAFCFLIPDEYGEFLKTVPTLEGSLMEMEQARFGIAHPELGALFIEKWWHLDPVIVQAVKESHLSASTQKTPIPCSQVVFFANEILNGIGIFNGIKVLAQPQAKEAAQQIGVPSEDLKKMLADVKKSLEAMEAVLNT